MVRRHQWCPPQAVHHHTHDFQLVRVLNIGCHEIQVTNEDIRRDPRPCLTANPSSHAPQSTTPLAQHSSSTARCSLVAKRVDETATPGGARDWGKGETKSAKQQHSEVMGIDSESSTGGNGKECQTRSWAALGTQHCPLVVRETGHDPRVTVDNLGAGSCFVLPPSAGTPWLKLIRLSWRRTGTVGQRSPTWRFEIAHLNNTSCFDDC